MFQNLELSRFNVVCSALGGFCFVYCFFSLLIKERLLLSECIPSTLFGFIFKETNWFEFDQYDRVDEITRDFARLVLGIQLMLAGVDLPPQYLKKAWLSLVMLLVPIMTIMWVASSLIIYLCIPNINFLESLIIGACITPTDPVLSGSLVRGAFSETHISKKLRNLILAESGANDGFGYPFLYLGLYIYRHKGVDIARHWLLYTVVYEIILGIFYGAVIGFIARFLIMHAYDKHMVDRESLMLSVLVVSIFIVGTAGLIGTDDLFACFIAGNVFNWNGHFAAQTEDDQSRSLIDLILNLGIFLWIGATVPWSLFNSMYSVWHLIVMGICVLIFRRLPSVLVLYRLIPEIGNLKESAFLGYFGPIGVGALFYLQVGLRQLDEWHVDPIDDYLTKNLRACTYFVIICSIIVHGLSVPMINSTAYLWKRSGKGKAEMRFPRICSIPTIISRKTAVESIASI